MKRFGIVPCDIKPCFLHEGSINMAEDVSNRRSYRMCVSDEININDFVDLDINPINTFDNGHEMPIVKKAVFESGYMVGKVVSQPMWVKLPSIEEEIPDKWSTILKKQYCRAASVKFGRFLDIVDGKYQIML